MMLFRMKCAFKNVSYTFFLRPIKNKCQITWTHDDDDDHRTDFLAYVGPWYSGSISSSPLLRLKCIISTIWQHPGARYVRFISVCWVEEEASCPWNIQSYVGTCPTSQTCVMSPAPTWVGNIRPTWLVWWVHGQLDSAGPAGLTLSRSDRLPEWHRRLLKGYLERAYNILICHSSNSSSRTISHIYNLWALEAVLSRTVLYVALFFSKNTSVHVRNQQRKSHAMENYRYKNTC